MRWVTFLMVLLYAPQAFGRSKTDAHVPLLSSDIAVDSTTPIEQVTKRSLFSLGLEFGTIAQSTNANPDFLGMQAQLGGRLLFRFPVSYHVFVRPSLGYFQRKEGNASAGVIQYLFDAGVTIQYVFDPSARFRPIAGASVRTEALLSDIYTPQSSVSSPISWQMRSGGVLGIAFSIDPNFMLVTDVEGGIRFLKPLRPYVGLTAGMLFVLD